MAPPVLAALLLVKLQESTSRFCPPFKLLTAPPAAQVHILGRERKTLLSPTRVQRVCARTSGQRAQS